MVGVNADTLWSAVAGGNLDDTRNFTESDHEVVVIQVNARIGKVYLNDSSSPTGAGGMEVPLGAFLYAWGYDSYDLVVVSKPDPTT